MSKQFLNIVAITTVLVIGGLFYLSRAGADIQADEPKHAADSKTYDVKFTDKGFSPRKLKIKSGDSVRWTNKTDMELQLAEGTHPKHTDCNYCPQGNKQGAYVSIDVGESYTFKFIGAGTANFHDHLEPEMKMAVTVAK